MTASDLTEWIAVFMMDLIPDGQGGARETVPAGLVPDIPARVEQQSATEVAPHDQRSADRVRYRVTIRYEPGLTTAHRIMWRDRFFDISGVKNIDMADTWLELTCERKESGNE